MNRLFNRERRGFTYIELLIVIAVLGVLGAIALPNFLQFRTQAMQAEAKANLTAWYAAERAYYLEENTYTESVLAVGFSPEPGNRYAYYFSSTPNCVTRTAAGESTVVPGNNCFGVDTSAHPGADPLPPITLPTITYTSGQGTNPGHPGMRGCSGSNCNISGFAAGNLDNEDVGIDSWFVATKDSLDFTARCGNPDFQSTAGVPILTYNDVTCNR